jgi:hypothetical protein
MACPDQLKFSVNDVAGLGHGPKTMRRQPSMLKLATAHSGPDPVRTVRVAPPPRARPFDTPTLGSF